MNETRVFADGYRGVFQKQEDFLECLKSIGRNSFWERRNSKNLRLVAITSGSKVEEELKEKYADEGLDEDIITDTIINTGLLLKVRNQYYSVRSCAIKSILDRAGISGAGLRRVEKSVYARILNDCLKVASCQGDLTVICNVLADYADMLDEFLQTDREGLGFCGALQYERMRDRCRKITADLQEKICYDRAAAIEKCRKRAGRKPKADAGIGEDALVLSARRRAGAQQKTEQPAAEQSKTE